MKKRLAALLAVLTLALSASLFASGTASATDGRFCRSPISADGLQVETCVSHDEDPGTWGEVHTWGTNNTSINLCVELVDANQNLVPNSRSCSVQQGNGLGFGDGGFQETPEMWNLPSGTYYAIAYFTSPTYWYGGESPPIQF
ncbi:hypothetical protein [Streptacidiphilus fuscans]|uniref:Secreted protein n=1 Tax=Streptacidiphilus fuscans TaxID=2789292 RepID=A0A931B532_9ACTN|nr:hypothetical protein [Streptacidiphilus fuscans]MBF9071365.1 hypothetical protein [Streptacidiphilus fuscans]